MKMKEVICVKLKINWFLKIYFYVFIYLVIEKYYVIEVNFSDLISLRWLFIFLFILLLYKI